MLHSGHMKSVVIIGAGQIGSRHLQALKAVKTPLDIIVLDNSDGSLSIAEERYRSMNASGAKHILNCTSAFPQKAVFDIAIIATSSGPRAASTKELLKKNKVKYLILEKILFQKKSDYTQIDKLLKTKRVKAWVNCPMRMMPFYAGLKKEFNGKKITYILYGNQSGMATDLIHHVDFVSFLTGSTDFEVDTRLLNKKLKESKRKGYLEITGSLSILFKNGSQLIIRCDADGRSPKIIEIFDSEKRYTILESAGKALISKAPDWELEEIRFILLYQSQLTTALVENLLNKGFCELPIFKESAKLHLRAFEPIRKYFKLKYYPFT